MIFHHASNGLYPKCNIFNEALPHFKKSFIMSNVVINSLTK